MNKLIHFVNSFNNCIRNNHTIALFNYSKIIHQILYSLEQKGLIKTFFINKKNQLVVYFKKQSDFNIIRSLKYISNNSKYKNRLIESSNSGLLTNTCFSISVTRKTCETRELFCKKNSSLIRNLLLLVFLN